MAPIEIKALRKRLKMTQAAFAQQLGVTPRWVMKLENAQSAPSPSLALLLRAFDLFGVNWTGRR